MSALPKSIQKQVAAAEAAHKKAYAKPEEVKSEEVTPDEKSQTPGEKVQPQEAAKTQAELKQQPATQAVPDTDEGEKAEDKVAPTSSETVDPWEKRYNILKGKYDAEVPRLAAQLREQKGEMDSLRGLLAKLEQTPSQQPSKPAGEVQKTSGLLRPEEISDYGEELIDVMKRAGQEVFNPEVAALKEELKQLKQQLGGVSQTLVSTKRDSVLDVLTKEVPDWQTLNTDELFLDWLDQTDPYSGDTRQDMLSRAFNNNDAARVIAFFKGYLNENEALQPAKASAAPQQRNTARNLEDMVAPGKPSGASGAAQKGEKRMWTQREIAAFYQKVNTGKYRSKPKEQEAIERDIVAAATEGRITS